MYGVDTADIDDESFLIGLFRRSKKFLNIKTVKHLKDKATKFQDPIEQNRSLFAIYFGFQKDGLKY